ncbi:hypothetical protein ACWT_3731 [Actinoplanes sp. SE50]|nr:hypothetical protein ACWT_3731 [Actinoplanes sp. SE50]
MTRPDRPPHPSLLRRGIGAVLVAVIAVATALLLQHKHTRTPAPQADRVLASMPLTGAALTAGSNAPLFDVRRMAPGHRVERCIVIAAASGGSVVRFGASGVSGALAPWLRVEGTIGTGTSRDCSDFAADATSFYTGSIAALGSAGTEGVPTGWVPGHAESRTFRIAVEVADDARAAGSSALATLTWRSQAPGVTPTTGPGTSAPSLPGTSSAAPTTTPPTTTPPTTTPPTTTPPTTTPPTTTPPTTTPPTTTPPSITAPAAARPSDSAVPPAGGGLPSGTVPGDSMAAAPCPPTTAARVGDLLAGVARFSWLALLLLLLVLLFLLVQDRLDRGDPKLAHAPLYGEPHQAFPDNGSIPWRTQ